MATFYGYNEKIKNDEKRPDFMIDFLRYGMRGTLKVYKGKNKPYSDTGSSHHTKRDR